MLRNPHGRAFIGDTLKLDHAGGAAGTWRLDAQEEIGAVMMVGFEGPLTDSVKVDWKGRQFGGLLVVNLNHNGGSATALTSVIASLRGLSRPAWSPRPIRKAGRFAWP